MPVGSDILERAMRKLEQADEPELDYYGEIADLDAFDGIVFPIDWNLDDLMFAAKMPEGAVLKIGDQFISKQEGSWKPW